MFILIVVKEDSGMSDWFFICVEFLCFLIRRVYCGYLDFVFFSLLEWVCGGR